MAAIKASGEWLLIGLFAVLVFIVFLWLITFEIER